MALVSPVHRIAVISALFAGLTCQALAAVGTPMTAAAPLTLGGIIDRDNDDTPAFTPDRKTVFFDRSSGSKKTVMISHWSKGHWSAPQAASFSGEWFDQDPVVAPDGSYVLFNSDRPVRPGTQPLVQDYFTGGPAPGSNIWRVDRKGDGWGEPVWLDAAINSDVFIDFASIAGDGTLYFMKWDAPEKAMHLWRSRYNRGSYATPEFVTLGDPKETIHDPAVAPDQSFIVFDAGRVKGGLGRMCIAFGEAGGWGKPIDLGDDINKDLPWGAHLDPDGHTIYYTGSSGIRRFSLRPWLASHGRNLGTHSRS
jgi:WD40-like Beta Propeller Repeat